MPKQPYVPPTIEIIPNETERKGNAHLKLPFGLCKKYGIHLPENATPRDAWNALKGIGINPGEEYDKFAEQQSDNETNKPNSSDDNTNNSGEIDKLFSDNNRFSYSGTFTKDYAKKQFDAGEQYHRDIITKAMQETGVTYRHGKNDECYIQWGQVYLTVDDSYGQEGNSYAEGEVFYHESYHAIDGGYAPRFGTLLSNTYTNDQGETLYDILKKEKRAFKSEHISDVKAARQKDVDAYLVSKGVVTAESIQNTEKTWKEQRDRLDSTIVWEERKAITESEEFKKANIANNTLKAQRMVYAKYLNKKYGFMSDILSQWNESMGMGHSMSYWRKDKYNASCEFFAEVGAHGATNKEALDVVRKYFPRSVEMAEKIINDIKIGKIKAR